MTKEDRVRINTIFLQAKVVFLPSSRLDLPIVLVFYLFIYFFIFFHIYIYYFFGGNA